MNSAPRPPASRPTRRIAAALGLALAGSAVAAWVLRRAPESVPAQKTVSVPSGSAVPVTLIVSGDTAGWIVPCGCTSNQSGGMLRRGTFVAEERARGEVIVVDAGGAPGGTSAYQRTRFEAILQGEIALGLAAHNLGAPEAALGADYLRDVARRLDVPFVSANVRDAAGKLIAEPCRIVQAGGSRIALVGVLSSRIGISGCRVDDPQAAVLSALEQHRGQYDWAVVLAYLPEPELRAFAAAVPEAHAVVGGPTGQSIAPERSGASLIASATNKGKFLVALSVPVGSSRLPWEGRVVEMSAKFADAPAQQEIVRAFRKGLAVRDFSAPETGFAPTTTAAAPADFRVAGSQACAACHADDCEVWQASAHARAWQTLVKAESQVDPECQRCHSTGYGLPGGFESIARSAARMGVGCESCHGPSLAHVRKPTKSKPPFIARDECRSCHDRENSPEFEFDAYWSQIVHGGKPTTSAVPPSEE